MQKSCWIIAAGSLALALPAHAADTLDLHLFEATYARADGVEQGATRIRTAMPAGSDLAAALSTLRHAGAHCAARPGASGLDCWYREPIAFDDVSTTLATWTIAVAAAQGRVTSVAVDRAVEQH